MLAESRCYVAFEGTREREREEERESTYVHDTRPRPIYQGSRPTHEVGGRRDPRCKLSVTAAAQMNECGRTRDWRGKSALAPNLRFSLHPSLPSIPYSIASPLFSSRAFPLPRNTNDSWLHGSINYASIKMISNDEDNFQKCFYKKWEE